MAVNGISGLSVTGTLSDGKSFMSATQSLAEQNQFEKLVQQMKAEAEKDNTVSGVSSSQVSRNHRLNGDYTQGFYGLYTREEDKTAVPQGFARNSTNGKGKKITIDKTSELYAQSMEMENYLVKIMMSSMRNTIQHTDLGGGNNNFARNMYEDMMYDNVAESMTKNAGLGLADEIYIELSGQR